MRRRLLQACAAIPLLPLAGCKHSPVTGGSFIQLWLAHLAWPREKWQSRLAATRALGCDEIFVQWVGVEGERDAAWAAPDTLLRLILDESDALGMGVHLGLTYDERWWTAIAAADDATVAGFLNETGARARTGMSNAPWVSHSAFRGWYIPYELEQYSWASPVRLDMLSNWLSGLSTAAIGSCGHEPTISTYRSALPSNNTLADMWSTLLDRVDIHPMIQDGAGVAGLENYRGLQPLHDMLVERRARFDLILELFEQLPPARSGTGFSAKTAPYSRVEAQWDIARDYGAQRVVAFAIDPWVLDDTPEAEALRQRWLSALGDGSRRAEPSTGTSR
ncbi:hypothetical protein Busp01_43500 [Trinickia caryophylli]|uniref:DUF4434 domain-containing protein n=2 Tax=Trinickia caryophylli TaxID=28094 RepID=A0A1X7F238_TRICW|nr:hypothetical protein Busp01_43500 [Trinickia caryophylli]SMF44537.1 protein of unknown function [Trinickia caryophylli]